MKGIDIYGISVQHGLPVLHVLEKGLVNDTHRNHIEIAREYYHRIPVPLEGILLIYGEEDGAVYTPKDFRPV